MHLSKAQILQINDLCAIFFLDLTLHRFFKKLAMLYTAATAIPYPPLIRAFFATLCHKEFPLPIMTEERYSNTYRILSSFHHSFLV